MFSLVRQALIQRLQGLRSSGDIKNDDNYGFDDAAYMFKSLQGTVLMHPLTFDNPEDAQKYCGAFDRPKPKKEFRITPSIRNMELMLAENLADLRLN